MEAGAHGVTLTQNGLHSIVKTHCTIVKSSCFPAQASDLVDLGILSSRMLCAYEVGEHDGAGLVASPGVQWWIHMRVAVSYVICSVQQNDAD
jgi:hypothetical protein